MNLTGESRTRSVVATVAALVVAGCAVGPNFERPAAPDVSSYTPGPVSDTAGAPDVAGGKPQHFANGVDLSADWWTLFHSAPLNELITQALANSPDLKAAQAALKVARENVLAQRGAYYPSVTGNFAASRQKQSGQIAPALNSNTFLYNLYTPQVNVSYVPDVFGLNRRTVESLQAQEQGVRYQMIAVYTTLTSNVVVTAFEASALQKQIDVTRQLIDSNTHALTILRYQFNKGYASGVDVAAQESQLAQVAATLPPLMKQLAQTRHQLAVLTGRFPSQVPTDALFDLSDVELPQELPVSLPSMLVEQRPDVLQAEANLHDTSARIGIAIANRLPNIELTAAAGSSAVALDQLFTSGTNFWSVGASATAPIFQGGTLLHQERAAKAAYTQAGEQYRSTVLTAFQNVADSLTALEQDAQALKATAAAADASKVALDLAQRQFQSGYGAYLGLLSAEQADQQAQINLVQAQASRFTDTAALFQALGGGWWHRADLTSVNYDK
jgi:NodT family efflux transporter outer membrane factor (OMF) lipoprotein